MSRLIPGVIAAFTFLSAQAGAFELATILGRPDHALEFVERLVQDEISLLDQEAPETDLSTGLYSILDKEGVGSTILIEALPVNGSVSFTLATQAIRAAALKASVVLSPFRSDIGGNDPLCLEMAKHPDVAFLFPAGSDGFGPSINMEHEPHCLSSNILFVATIDQENQNLAPFSNWGTPARLAAPGVNIPMVSTGGTLVTRSGGSAALAFAAAQISIYARNHPDKKGANLIEAFLEEATFTLEGLNGKVEGDRAIFPAR